MYFALPSHLHSGTLPTLLASCAAVLTSAISSFRLSEASSFWPSSSDVKRLILSAVPRPRVSSFPHSYRYQYTGKGGAEDRGEGLGPAVSRDIPIIKQLFSGVQKLGTVVENGIRVGVDRFCPPPRLRCSTPSRRRDSDFPQYVAVVHSEDYKESEREVGRVEKRLKKKAP